MGRGSDFLRHSAAAHNRLLGIALQSYNLDKIHTYNDRTLFSQEIIRFCYFTSCTDNFTCNQKFCWLREIENIHIEERTGHSNLSQHQH